MTRRNTPDARVRRRTTALMNLSLRRDDSPRADRERRALCDRIDRDLPAVRSPALAASATSVVALEREHLS